MLTCCVPHPPHPPPPAPCSGLDPAVFEVLRPELEEGLDPEEARLAREIANSFASKPQQQAAVVAVAAGGEGAKKEGEKQ